MKHRKNSKKRFSLGIILAVFCFLTTFPLIQAAAQSQPKDGDSHYLIGPNDLLNIFVWKETELTRDITVMPDGRITFPLIGEIMAEGKTVTELKDTITEKLKNYITAPEVTVIVKESRSRIIYTIGKVVRPGPYGLAPDMTVLQALSNAGGFAEWADEKNVLIIRREGGKETQLHFNYKEYIAGKNIEQNVILKPGDTIVVP
ncbi:MAG: polysaccharide biosynthesis/export family protein [Deltaproteobacteria bacterium]|nr:polysaccharide biosynthesis/export family protein [Deltaproteobacteria bacterium]MBW2130747.1 polysaccharide biosynthesis/export family protein [Deltaproteobacteria bacterium]MBW2302658.1 polysaccharide biosynthesis/export family protein [Deltaproteobacteria bacterium]